MIRARKTRQQQAQGDDRKDDSTVSTKTLQISYLDNNDKHDDVLESEKDDSKGSKKKTGGVFIQQIQHFKWWSLVWAGFYHFFHARTDIHGCRLTGYIRVAYALLFLYSRWLLFVELPFLMDPVRGVLPYRVTQRQVSDSMRQYSLWETFPNSSVVLYAFYTLGLVHGLLLLVGLYPRWQAAGIFVFLMQLHKHNDTLWDNSEIMLRLWAFMLVWLPLDHITYQDGFGGLVDLEWIDALFSALKWRRWRRENGPVCPFEKLDKVFDDIDEEAMKDAKDSSEEMPLQTTGIRSTSKSEQTTTCQTTSWPMWPFRFWQIYTCLIYMGAGFGKYVTEPWYNGYALLYCWYDEGFGRFFPSLVQEYLFNRLISVQFMTYTSLLVECICVVTIWPRCTRWATFVAIVLLHVGIELTLLMHIFEYLSVLGWVCFFVYPATTTTTTTKHDAMVTSTLQDEAGQSNTTVLVQKGKSFCRKVVVSSSSDGGPSRLILDSLVALIVLWLLIASAFPHEVLFETVSWRPLRPLMRHLMLNPMRNAMHQVMPILQPIGLFSGPWTLFRGRPPHSNSRITAVIRFHDNSHEGEEDEGANRQPLVWKSPEWINYTLYERERYYWSDDYYYYLLEDFDVDTIPFFASLAMYLSQQHSSNGSIHKDDTGDNLIIDLNNDIASITFMGHWEIGIDPPRLDQLGWWEPIPRGFSYTSTCSYAIRFPRRQTHHHDHYYKLSVADLLDYDDGGKFREQNGCQDYFTRADKELHMKAGSYDTGKNEDDDDNEANKDDDGKGNDD